MGLKRVAIAVPGDLSTPTGGYAYDDRIIRELRALGWEVGVIDLGDGFPNATAEQRQTTLRLLQRVPEGIPIVMDGLALGAIPDIASQIARSHRLIALVHHPLALETGLTAEEAAQFRKSERAALAAAHGVIVTGRPAANVLESDFGVSASRITIAPPGADPAPQSHGGDGMTINLLAVGAIVPRKGYDVLIAALSIIDRLPWRLMIVGDRSRNPATAAALDNAIGEARLGARILAPGAISNTDLADAYLHADIFVMSSHYEGYGMAAARAIAHGVPVIATQTGAVAETIGDAGRLVPPNDPQALADALRAAIVDRTLPARWRSAAQAAATRLPRWRASAETIARMIEGRA